jgi:hypothetical protein
MWGCGGGGRWERDGLGGRDDCGLGGSSGFSVVDHEGLGFKALSRGQGFGCCGAPIAGIASPLRPFAVHRS